MLTDRQIKTLPTTGRPYREREKATDPGLRGFGVQISAAGAKSFYLEYSFNGRRGNFFKLGTYPAMSLVEARQACRETRKLLDGGIDPKAELERRRVAEVAARKEQERQQRLARTVGCYEDLVALYLASLRNPTTRREIARLFEKDAKPELRERKVTEIEPADIRRVLARAHQRGAKRVPWMLHRYLHAAFAYAISVQEAEGVLYPLERNPVAAVRKPDDGITPGERVLSLAEIPMVWHALEADRERLSPFSIGAIRLLLLTGQRLQEVLRAYWTQVDLREGTWLFPRAQTKTNRPHLLPITPRMQATFAQIPKLGTRIFPHRKKADATMPFRTITQAIDRLCVRHAIEPFSPRDLRRTCTTHWARIGIQPSVRYQLQNRALGDIESLHYNLYDGLPEKRAALEKWDRELERMIEGVPSPNVVALRPSA